MYKKLLYTCYLFLISFTLQGQDKSIISGKVIDAQNGN
ncbi:MAG: hypothetical protein RI924_1116, partial [Bacteroidota bacterium]